MMNKDLKVICVGGGPAAIYFSIVMKLKNPSTDITIIEKNPPNCTSGWGVILPDNLLENLLNIDPQSALLIKNNFVHWKHISVYCKEKLHYIGGHQFSAIGRLILINILQDRARELGVNLIFNTPVEPYHLSNLRADIVVIADGASSKIREHFASFFQVTLDQRTNKYKWLGTTQSFKESFSFIFEETKHGLVWAHCYQFDENYSTFVVECNESTWKKLEFDTANEEETLTLCETIFKKHLNQHPLLNNLIGRTGKSWISFPVIKCERWFHQNMVLIGDAAHTTHFSIGSGTRLALDDAMVLADCLNSGLTIESSLKKYQETRQSQFTHLITAANNSMRWFEQVNYYYARLSSTQFTYSLLTRSGVIRYENIRKKDSVFLDEIQQDFFKLATDTTPNFIITSPIDTPICIKETYLKNRRVFLLKNYSAIKTKPKLDDIGLIFIETVDDLNNYWTEYDQSHKLIETNVARLGIQINIKPHDFTEVRQLTYAIDNLDLAVLSLKFNLSDIPKKNNLKLIRDIWSDHRIISVKIPLNEQIGISKLKFLIELLNILRADIIEVDLGKIPFEVINEISAETNTLILELNPQGNDEIYNNNILSGRSHLCLVNEISEPII